MANIKQVVKIPCSLQQTYALVTQIDQYPEFVSWCKNAVINSSSTSNIRATIEGYKLGISFRFLLVYLLHSQKLIEVNLPTGFFRKIEGFWRFDEITPQSTQLSFELNYEFANALLSWTVTPIIKSEIKNFMQALSERAKKLYG